MNHIINNDEAVEYLKQFAWVKDFDTVIERLLDPKTINEEKDDEDKNV